MLGRQVAILTKVKPLTLIWLLVALHAFTPIALSSVGYSIGIRTYYVQLTVLAPLLCYLLNHHDALLGSSEQKWRWRRIHMITWSVLFGPILVATIVQNIAAADFIERVLDGLGYMPEVGYMPNILGYLPKVKTYMIRVNGQQILFPDSCSGSDWPHRLIFTPFAVYLFSVFHFFKAGTAGGVRNVSYKRWFVDMASVVGVRIFIRYIIFLFLFGRAGLDALFGRLSLGAVSYKCMMGGGFWFF